MFFISGEDHSGAIWKSIVFAEASTAGHGSRSIMGGGGGGGLFGSGGSPSNVGVALAVTAIAGLVLAVTIDFQYLILYSYKGNLNPPWSRRRRKHPLVLEQWSNLFGPDGKFIDGGGVKFLKKVRSGGVDPSIRVEVWPFLLGVYAINSSGEERDSIKSQNREEYQNLRRQAIQSLSDSNESLKLKETAETCSNEEKGESSHLLDSPIRVVKDPNHVIPDPSLQPSFSDTPVSTIEFQPSDSDYLINDSSGEQSVSNNYVHSPALHSSDSVSEVNANKSGIICANASDDENEYSSEQTENTVSIATTEGTIENDHDQHTTCDSSPSKTDNRSKSYASEDFSTWQRIIRLDAIRANPEWVSYSPSQAAVSEIKARQLAVSVGLEDYDDLEPCRIFHAARLVAILEAYALYDPEIGYCQGMSDLLSPIISVIESDYEAFWCFVFFMKKARNNFRLDEVGIRRQLNLVSKIIKSKDSHLYKHLEKLEAQDCFFVYRMVVVLFRRELSFEQTLCLWEVMWADQAAIRAGIRLRAPANDDLLLYAIAACVLRRRKMIIEKYNSMDEIMRECNSMAGNLDVWKLVDDAHDLVVNVHDKI